MRSGASLRRWGGRQIGQIVEFTGVRWDRLGVYDVSQSLRIAVWGTIAVRLGLLVTMWWILSSGHPLTPLQLDGEILGTQRGGLSGGPLIAGMLLFVMTVFNTILIIVQFLQKHRLPLEKLVVFGAMADMLWGVLAYMQSGLQPVPALVFLVASLALHAVLLPAGTVAVMTGVATLLITGLQIWVAAALRVETAVFSSLSQAVLLMGLGCMVGGLGAWVRSMAQRYLVLQRRLQYAVERSGFLTTELPIACLWWDTKGVVERIEGALEPPAGEWMDLVSRDSRLSSLLSTTAEGRTKPWTGDLLWSPRGGTLDDLRVFTWTLIAQPATESGQPGTSTLASLNAASQPPAHWRWFLVLQERTMSAQSERLVTELAIARDTAWLSAGLAHELRTPLGVIQTSVEQLADPEMRSNLSTEDTATLQRVVTDEVQRLSRYIGDVLAYAKLPDDLQAPRVPLDVVLATVVTRAAAAPAGPGGPVILRDIELLSDKKFDTNAEILHSRPIPLVSEGLVVLAIQNLCANAQQHSPAGVPIEIRNGPAPQSDRWWIEVWDSGPGIPPAQREAMLRPFASGRRGGTGLGLSLAARAAGLLGGRLELRERPDGREGLCARVVLSTKMVEREVLPAEESNILSS